MKKLLLSTCLSFIPVAASADPISIGTALVAGGFAAASAGTTGLAIFGLTLSATQAFFVVAAANLGLSLLQKALAPKPELPNLSNFSQRGTDRTQLIRQPITAWEYVFGDVIKGGVLTFAGVTPNNRYLHMVVTVACHPCNAVIATYVNETPIYASDLDSDGVVTTGEYADFVKLQYNLGTVGSQPFPDLVGQNLGWKSDWRQEGHTKVYIRLRFNRNKFPNGLPKLKFRVEGAKFLDTRDSTTKYSTNPVMAIRHYVTTDDVEGGAGWSTSEILESAANASANVCDQMVAVKDYSYESCYSTASDDTIGIPFPDDEQNLRLFTGDVVHISGDDLPTGISAGTDYYIRVIRENMNGGDGTIKLATSLANAFAGTFINLTDSVEDLTVTRKKEPRYTLNGVFSTDQTPKTILSEMKTAMAGAVVPVGGSWVIKAGFYSSPTVFFDEDDVISDLNVVTKHSRRDLFNAVQGVFSSYQNFGQPTNYPIVTSTTYEEEDGEQILTSLDLPYTNRPSTCQRVAMLYLQRHRRQLTFKSTFKLTAMQIQATDTFGLSNTRFGWSSKVFELDEWKFMVEGDPPALAVDIAGTLIDSAAYDWDETVNESLVAAPPLTNLPDPTTVGAPAGLTVTESLYETREGGGLKVQALFSWMAPDDDFVTEGGHYVVEYKLSSATDYIVMGNLEGTQRTIFDIQPGVYNFRVKAVNYVGFESDYVSLTQEIFGLSIPPTEPQNLTISAVGGLAVLRWDRSDDLDVREGGEIVFRHSASDSPTWQSSVTIGVPVDGRQTVAVLPLKEGTYLAKSKDNSGILSEDFASVETKQATVLTFANLSSVVEHTVFSGDKTDCAATDGVLILIGDTLIDDIPDFDDVPSLDTAGGIVSSGTYSFASGFDFGSVVKRRLTGEIEVLVFNALDFFDDREDFIDTWENFDGNSAGSGDAQIWFRTTDDDPSGSPTWGAWNKLDTAEVECRGVEFECRLSVVDSSYNIQVSVLAVHAEEVS